MTVVVDASIVLRLLLSRKPDDLLNQRFSPRRGLHAPQLIDAEVAGGIRGLMLGHKLDPGRAEEMVSDFSALRIIRHPMTSHLRRIITLRHNLSAYDACYVALAEALPAPLLTLDARFEGASGHRAEVHVYPRE